MYAKPDAFGTIVALFNYCLIVLINSRTLPQIHISPSSVSNNTLYIWIRRRHPRLAGNLGDCFLRDAQSVIPATVVDLFVNEVFVNFAIRQTNARSSIFYLEKIRLKAVSSRRWRSLLSDTGPTRLTSSPNQEDVHGVYECRKSRGGFSLDAGCGAVRRSCVCRIRWVQRFLAGPQIALTGSCS